MVIHTLEKYEFPLLAPEILSINIYLKSGPVLAMYMEKLFTKLFS